MKPFEIYTPYGNHYKVNEKGQIYGYNNVTPSDLWRFNGFVERLPFGHLRFNVPIEDVLERPSFQNGKPRFTVSDIDHGTTRVWANMDVHGVRFVRYM